MTEDNVGSATKKRKIQPPEVQSRSIHTRTAPPPKRSRIDNSSLMIDNPLRYFRSGGANFSYLLREKGQAYFDRTRYISVLAKIDKNILFFRPRRFGKSLTVSMLNHFHGLQYTEEHQSFYEVSKHVPDYPSIRN
jgi:Predicted AAA-ATPase